MKFHVMYLGKDGRTRFSLVEADSELGAYSRALDLVASETPPVATEPVQSSIVVMTVED